MELNSEFQGVKIHKGSDEEPKGHIPYEPVPIILKKALTPKQVKARNKSKMAKKSRKRNRK